MLEHWRSLLAAVLDLQDQQQEAAVADSGSAQQQQAEQPQPQRGNSRQKKAGGGGSSLVPPGPLPEKLSAWLQQPDSRRHYLRVTLECLRELAAAEIPARVLLQHQVGVQGNALLAHGCCRWDVVLWCGIGCLGQAA